jgi:hypothetical protein
LADQQIESKNRFALSITSTLLKFEAEGVSNGSCDMISKSPAADERLTATELRKLPTVERDAVLAAAAALAENEYRTNPRLSDFEAFGEDDLHGESSAPATR